MKISTSGKSPLLGRSNLVGRASHAGLVSYRLINDEPHYVSVMDHEETTALTARYVNLK